MKVERLVVSTLVVGVLLGGCGPKAPRRIKRPMPLPGVTASATPLNTSSSADRRPGSLDTDERTLATVEDKARRAIVGVVETAGLRLRGDRGVDAACRSTSTALLRAGDLGAVASHLRLELQKEQITDVSYLPFTFQMKAGGPVPGDVLDFIRRETRERGVTHIGVGAAQMRGKTLLVTAVLLRRLSLLSAFPRQVKEGSRHLLWVKPGTPMIRSPRAIVATPDGGVFDLAGTTTTRGLELPIAFDAGKGRYVVQVLAEDAYGLQVTNQMEVWVGQPAMRVEKAMPEAEWGTDTATQEAHMVELVNRYRQRHGLKPLRISRGLTETARMHSLDMKNYGYFGHRSPNRGELLQRTEDVPGIRGVSENIAMSVSITWAHDGLIASPSHRRNLLDPAMTHVGIGVVSRDSGPIRVVYITQHLGQFAAGFGE